MSSSPHASPLHPNPLADACPTVSTYKVDELLGHLTPNHGLFSKATFLNLYACFVRLIRDQRLKGTVLTLMQGQDDFQLVSLGLQACDNINIYALDAHARHSQQEACLLSPGLGAMVVLTDKLSAYLYWNQQTQDTFRMLQGGWSFHPGDTKTLATQLADWFELEELQHFLADGHIDRRYDDKLSLIVSSLVANLEARNRDLTMALVRENQLNDRIVNSERLAAIGQLCSVIAHEIRNPLGLIDLYASLVDSHLQQLPDCNELTLANLQQIKQATQHLDSILQELTQYSRPLELKVELLELVAFVQNHLEFMRPSFDQKGIPLSFELALAYNETTLPIQADATRLRQAMTNLLKNALEATPEGKAVVVTVSQRTNDTQVFIKVRDEGKGIAEDTQSKLFTPYFSTKGSEGTGLGLAHTRKVMQAHGGNAQLLWSTPEQGSCFALVLPLTEPPSH
jgi:signal transduction histidine kinase